MRRDTWLLPQPVRTAVIAMTGFVDGNIDASTSNVENSTPRDSMLDGNAPLGHDLDVVIRFENLAEDFHAACESIGIPPVDLPVRNRSARESYEAYYDDELRELVAATCAPEIELFRPYLLSLWRKNAALWGDAPG